MNSFGIFRSVEIVLNFKKLRKDLYHKGLFNKNKHIRYWKVKRYKQMFYN